jgi:hypothetical protein
LWFNVYFLNNFQRKIGTYSTLWKRFFDEISAFHAERQANISEKSILRKTYSLILKDIAA